MCILHRFLKIQGMGKYQNTVPRIQLPLLVWFLCSFWQRQARICLCKPALLQGFCISGRKGSQPGSL